MIDAHCHLHSMLRHYSLEQIKSMAVASGVCRVITCACSLTDWSMDITDQFFVPQYGIHPWWAAESRPDDWLEILRMKLVQNPHCGIGEIGLDKNKRGNVPFDIQLETFTKQLKLSIELDRTCTVHCVNAFGPLISVLKQFGPLKCPIVFHSFSGSVDSIREISRHVNDVYFSVSSQCPRDAVIPHIPIEKLLIETDSPDQPFEGDFVNDCSKLDKVANRVATIIGFNVEEVRFVTMRNTIRAFRLAPSM